MPSDLTLHLETLKPVDLLLLLLFYLISQKSKDPSAVKMKLLPIKYNWSCTVIQVMIRCWKKKKKRFSVLSLHEILSKGDLLLLSYYNFYSHLRTFFKSFSFSASTCFLNILTENVCFVGWKEIYECNKHLNKLYKMDSGNCSGYISISSLKAEVTSPSQWISSSLY